MQQYSDAELVALYLESKGPQFLTELFTRHSDIVYRSALRIMKNPSDAEDIMQTVYCKMITSLHLYKGTGSVIGWMLQIVIHTCYNQLQSDKSRNNRDKKIMSERVQTVSPKNDELKEMMETHLNKLPEIYKVPITLQIMEGLTIKEVSEALEIPEKTIRSQIARGLEKLKVSLQNVGITASVISIGDSLKEVSMPMAPASIKSNAYFHSLIKSKAAASTKLAVSAGSKSFVSAKVMALILAAGVSIVAFISLQKHSSVSVAPTIVASQKWDFENVNNVTEYQDIGLERGGIHIEDSRGVNNSKCLVTDDEAIIELDITKYKMPIRISYQLDVLIKDGMQNSMLFKSKKDLNGKHPVLLSELRENLDIKPNQNLNRKLGFCGNWFSHISYLDVDSYDCWIDGKRSHIMLDTSLVGNKVYLSFKGKTLIDNLKIESIESSALPNKSACMAFVATTPYKEGAEVYNLDKVALGLDKNSTAKPKISFNFPDVPANRSGKSNTVIAARIAESGKVEWSVVRQKLVKKLEFEGFNDVAAFELVHGSIFLTKERGENNSSCLAVDKNSVFSIDISQFKLPLKISYSFDIVLAANASENGTLTIKNNLKPDTNIFNITNLQISKVLDSTEGSKRTKIKNKNIEVGFAGFWSYRTLYITDDCVDIWYEGKRSGMIFQKSLDNKKLYFYILDQTIIDNFIIESIEPKEAPDHSQFKNFVSKIPFQKEPRGFNFDKTNFDLDKDCVPLVRIYDNEYIEKALGLNKSLKVEVIGNEIMPTNNSIFEPKKEPENKKP